MSRGPTIDDLPPELLAVVFYHLREPLDDFADEHEATASAAPLLAAAC